ncbi:MAG: hypothetical protein WB998_10145 [Solirubrobacteraceae bacterium]
MGLLDDAIREHLELKRLRGADPSDVARQEDAALGPVRRDQSEPEDHAGAAGPEASPPEATDAAPRSDSSTGQETVEINMEAELAESDREQMPSDSATRATPAAHPSSGQASSGDSLEWEMPGDRHDDLQTARGDEREDEDIRSGSESQQNVDAPVEDVLEETPDFLRDTPEQDRLWFEQRPPRDFDFNE